MREIEPELAKKGASIIPIGNGRATFIKGFRQSTGIAGPGIQGVVENHPLRPLERDPGLEGLRK